MNEIISSILSAEQKSDEIIKSSNEKARVIILQGENDAESIFWSAMGMASESVILQNDLSFSERGSFCVLTENLAIIFP